MYGESLAMVKNSKTEKKSLATERIDFNLSRDYFTDEQELLRYKKEFYQSNLREQLKEKAEEFSQKVRGKTQRGYDFELADLGFEQGIYLYSILRKLKPEVAVETGVCNGFSSAFILLALEKNHFGKLYSLDWPEVAGVTYEEERFWRGKRGAVIPPNQEPGWVIPVELKSRWELILGRTQDKLPELYAELKKIDFFLHDSEHSYECMWFECNQSYEVLRSSGIMMFDDISWNCAFQNFAQKKNKKIFYIGEDLGFLIK